MTTARGGINLCFAFLTLQESNVNGQNYPRQRHKKTEVFIVKYSNKNLLI